MDKLFLSFISWTTTRCLHICTRDYGLRLALLVSLAFIGLALMIQPHASQAAPPAQAPDSPPQVSGGRALWAENCQPCHGPTGRGDGPTAQAIENPIPDLTDPTVSRQNTPVDNFDVIKNGRMESMMPPWGNRLTDDQIWDLAAYVWSLGVPSGSFEAGETVYLEQCAACHGAEGTGDGPEAPAEMIDFTSLEAMAQRSQADLQAGFAASSAHEELAGLSEEQLWQTLSYVRTFSFALPQRNGTLQGQIRNATSNQPQGNIEVTLYAFAGSTPLETYTAQADENGNYSFENLQTDHSIFYVIEGRYQEVSYLSEPVPFVPDNPEMTLDLEVYETTTDNAAISVSRLHYLISFTPDDTMRIIQLFVIGNSGDQTYIGQNGQTFSFTLPQAATNVSFQGDAGSNVTETADGYAATEPVRPGEEGLLIAAVYDVSYTDDELSIDVPIPADVAAVTVLMQDLGANLASEQLQFVETRETQEGRFSIFSGSNLPQGSSLTLTLSELNELEFAAAMPGSAPPGATVAPPDTVDQNLLRWLIVGLGGVAILLTAFLYPRFRSRLAAQTVDEAEDLTARRQKLLLLLARLDDAFEAGELDERVYRQARAGYKAKLLELMEG